MAYAAFVHGLYNRWTYFFRSCSVPVDHLNCLEEKIRYKFIPALSGRSSINVLKRDWLALPNCFGGMGLIYPTQYSNSQYQASLAITRHFVDCILNGERELPYEVMERQMELVDEHSSKRANEVKLRVLSVRERLDGDHQRLMDVACELGVSVWLSALPLKEFGFNLHKSSFRNAICIRYGWQPPQLPSVCICGKTFNVDHALSCLYDGFPTLRHNEL